MGGEKCIGKLSLKVLASCSGKLSLKPRGALPYLKVVGNFCMIDPPPLFDIYTSYWILILCTT